MQTVILAGGKGTRLRAVLGNRPKPLIDIAGKPLLLRQIALARKHGLHDILLLTGYGGSAIRNLIGDGAASGVSVRYHEEDGNYPLGTAGALLSAFDDLCDTFVVMYADCMLDVDLGRMIRCHAAHAADATLFVHPNDHPYDSDLVDVDPEGRVVAFHAYPHPRHRWLPNLVNAALYVMEKAPLAPHRARCIGLAKNDRPQDISKSLFPGMLSEGCKLFAYRSPEYISDAGTPERYEKVVGDFRSGRIERMALDHSQKAIFLDRDGTLNEEVDRVKTPDELTLIEGAAAAVRQINRSDYRAVVITNQPVLAHGDCDEPTLAQIHAKLDTLLGRGSAYLDALYYCPHHPDRGFPREVAALKIACDCRKPAIGLLKRAAAELNVDLHTSWLIGDTTVDVRTAHAAAARAVLLRTGRAGTDAKFADRPDYTFLSLGEAVDFIVNRHPALMAQARAFVKNWMAGDWVAVGGRAGAGKSTWASVLAEALAERGIPAPIVSLDGWFLAPEKRVSGLGVRGRFDLGALREDLVKLAQSGRLPLRYYDRRCRRPQFESESVVIEPSRFAVIFEGVVALGIAEIRDRAAHRLFVETDESRRRDFFIRDYAWRGDRLCEGAAARLYDCRLQDEIPVVDATRQHATAVLRGA